MYANFAIDDTAPKTPSQRTKVYSIVVPAVCSSVYWKHQRLKMWLAIQHIHIRICLILRPNWANHHQLLASKKSISFKVWSTTTTPTKQFSANRDFSVTRKSNVRDHIAPTTYIHTKTKMKTKRNEKKHVQTLAASEMYTSFSRNSESGLRWTTYSVSVLLAAQQCLNSKWLSSGERAIYIFY